MRVTRIAAAFLALGSFLGGVGAFAHAATPEAGSQSAAAVATTHVTATDGFALGAGDDNNGNG